MRYVSRKEQFAVMRAQAQAKAARQARHRRQRGLGALGVLSDNAPLLAMAALFVGVPVAIGYLGQRAAEDRGWVA
jgi:hypothetical protein